MAQGFYYADVMSHIQSSRKGAIKFINKEKNLFFPTLKKRVDQYFADRQLSRLGNTTLFAKTLLLLLLYLAPFVAMLIWTPGWPLGLLCWLLMAFGMAGIGMSVMHDANHGAYSTSAVVNWCMSHLLNLLGGSTINWKLQHNILHHTYTNIRGMDDDIADKPVLRLSPHAPLYKAHRFQWWHAFLLYGLTTLYWATAKDFLQWVRYRRSKVNAASTSRYRWMLVKLIAGKVIYFSIFFFLPLMAGVPLIQVLTGFLLMHFVAGLLLTVIFQLAHSLEGTSHPLPNAAGVMRMTGPFTRCILL